MSPLHVNAVLFLSNPSALADLLLKQQQPYRTRCCIAAAGSLGGRRGVRNNRSSRGGQLGTAVFDRSPKTVKNRSRSLGIRGSEKRNVVSSSFLGSSGDLCTSAAPQTRKVEKKQFFVAAAPHSARRRPPGDDSTASFLYSCSNFSPTSSQTPATWTIFSKRSLLASNVSRPYKISSWPFSTRRLFSVCSQLCSSTPPPFSFSSFCTSFSSSNLSSSRFLFSRSSSSCAPLSSPLRFRQTRPPPSHLDACASRRLLSLPTCRPHSSLISSFPLPTESYVRNVQPAPASLCLMMKWYLEKIGADSSSLQCFLPAEIAARGKDSLQQQQQQQEKLDNTNTSSPHSSSNSCSVGCRTEGSSPQQTTSNGSSPSSEGEGRSEEKTTSSSALRYGVNSSPRHTGPDNESDSSCLERNVTSASDSSSTRAVDKGLYNVALQASSEKAVKIDRAVEQVQVASPKQKRDFYEGWIEAKLCFGSFPSKALRDAFRKTYDERLLRWGRLLELLDCFAGDIAYHYCTPHEEGYSKVNTLMVTASIQRMEFIDNVGERTCHLPSSCSDVWSTGSSEKNSSSDSSSSTRPTPSDSSESRNSSRNTIGKTGQVVAELNVEEDLWMIGHVTQSGASSMGIRIEIQQGGVRKGSVFFVMVAVNPEGRPAKIVPQLDVSSCSPELQKLIRACSAEFKARKALAAKIFSLVPPDPEESLFLHETWKKSLAGGSQVVWMRDTRLQSAELIQPEALSRYNRAFGGLVARKALELSYLTAQCFLRVLQPCLRGVDDMFFLEPLYVGDMLLMAATVLWSTPEEIQIQVEAFREDPLSGGRQRTNLFNFRYDTEKSRRQCDISSRTAFQEKPVAAVREKCEDARRNRSPKQLQKLHTEKVKAAAARGHKNVTILKAAPQERGSFTRSRHTKTDIVSPPKLDIIPKTTPQCTKAIFHYDCVSVYAEACFAGV